MFKLLILMVFSVVVLTSCAHQSIEVKETSAKGNITGVRKIASNDEIIEVSIGGMKAFRGFLIQHKLNGSLNNFFQELPQGWREGERKIKFSELKNLKNMISANYNSNEISSVVDAIISAKVYQHANGKWDLLVKLNRGLEVSFKNWDAFQDIKLPLDSYKY